MEDLARRLAALDAKLDPLPSLGDNLRAQLGQVHADLLAADRRLAVLGDEVAELRTALRYVQERAADNRRRLNELRRSEEYELAFTESEPLVSFIVPTHTRFESLRDVSLPSILGQTYSNLEVIVSGDCAPTETERVVAALGDPRVRFHNRSVRGPYPNEEERRWYVVGTPPYNDALALASGRWIAGLGDDDAVRQDHTETLVRAAQAGRLEHCYGRMAMRYRNGEDYAIGTFPPRLGEFGLQNSIYHAGLSFFELEPPDYLYDEPNDWSLCRRMLAAGVRFGMVDDVVTDKYETRYDSPDDWKSRGIPTIE
jgi:glycosyltransferase involved in cell wall biosynthesis